MKHLIAAIGLIAIPPIAYSAPDVGTQEFSISGSGSSDKDFDSNIFSMDAAYGQYLSPDAEVGVRQSVSVSDHEGEESVWNGSTRVFYDHHFGRDTLKPYLGANLGYIYGESVDESFIAAPEAGLKYYVADSTFVVGQVEYQFLFEDADEADNRFSDGVFVYGVGMGYNF
ncbi:hypothetical protein HCH_00688 [Hahella chejuensis KCTC 2396]|uniref:Outer membrane protein beta-barrel domain-containing protein n=1 Tax=Hahella chejuensis (strain KCTC 2396) TaxID=349521 RepID=Q2SP37_HAHCH|nr:hypothetical protein [Hahella chejuensis]ABC27587.1 hypothetical protein HCH_00688 [Hahella chejuensis KCTC 2396]